MKPVANPVPHSVEQRTERDPATAQAFQEWVVSNVATFLTSVIRSAAEQRLETGMGRTYDIVRKSWPEELSRSGSSLQLPDQAAPLYITSAGVKFYPSRDDGDGSPAQCGFSMLTGEYTGLNFYLGSLDKPTTREELKVALDKMERHIWHEAQHIFDAGTSPDFPDTPTRDQTRLAWAEYQGHPGELAAHAREYAMHWRQEHPGTPFNGDQFYSEFIAKYGNDTVARNYFVNYKNPTFVSEVKALDGGPDVAEIQTQLLARIEGFLAIGSEDRSAISQHWNARQASMLSYLEASLPQLRTAADHPAALLAEIHGAVLTHETARAIKLTEDEVLQFLARPRVRFSGLSELRSYISELAKRTLGLTGEF